MGEGKAVWEALARHLGHILSCETQVWGMHKGARHRNALREAKMKFWAYEAMKNYARV